MIQMRMQRNYNYNIEWEEVAVTYYKKTLKRFGDVIIQYIKTVIVKGYSRVTDDGCS